MTNTDRESTSRSDQIDSIVVGPAPPLDFATFYASEIRAVVDLAFVLCGDRATAEDLAQEAFAAAFRKWSRIGTYDKPGAFVRRVVANRRVSWFRRQIREARAKTRMYANRESLQSTDMSLPPPAAQVWAAVRSLPRRQAQVIALHYADGMSLAEIGGVLEISKESVHTHLKRGRATLAVRLQHLEA